MRLYLSVLAGLLLYSHFVKGQADAVSSETLILNGLVIDNNNKAIPNIDITLQVKQRDTMGWIKPPTGEKRTNNSGKFQFVIPRKLLKEINRIKFTIENNNWRIASPKNGEDDPKGEVSDGILYTYEITGELILQTSEKGKREIIKLNNENKALKDDNASLKNQLTESSKNKDANNELANQLREKLQKNEIALRQLDVLRDSLKKNLHSAVFTSLNTYVEDLKNLNQKITPSNIRDAFIFEGTRNELAKRMGNYNESRELLTKLHDTYTAQVGNVWSKKEQSRLSLVYDFILRDIHLNLLATRFNSDIIGNIDAFTKQMTPRLLAQRKAVKAAKELEATLNPKITSLDDKIVELRIDLN